jgi:hypothetical protein
MQYSLTSVRALLLPLAAAATVAGCGNPVSGGSHVQPAGVVIRQGTTVLVRVLGQTFTGDLEFEAGTTSRMLTVRFLDRNGQEIDPPSGYWLNVESGDPTIAEWEPTANGAFTGRINAIIAGDTYMDFLWIHGPVGGGHEDFGVRIDVTVEAEVIDDASARPLITNQPKGPAK